MDVSESDIGHGTSSSGAHPSRCASDGPDEALLRRQLERLHEQILEPERQSSPNLPRPLVSDPAPRVLAREQMHISPFWSASPTQPAVGPPPQTGLHPQAALRHSRGDVSRPARRPRGRPRRTGVDTLALWSHRPLYPNIQPKGVGLRTIQPKVHAPFSNKILLPPLQKNTGARENLSQAITPRRTSPPVSPHPGSFYPGSSCPGASSSGISYPGASYPGTLPPGTWHPTTLHPEPSPPMSSTSASLTPRVSAPNTSSPIGLPPRQLPPDTLSSEPLEVAADNRTRRTDDPPLLDVREAKHDRPNLPLPLEVNGCRRLPEARSATDTKSPSAMQGTNAPEDALRPDPTDLHLLETSTRRAEQGLDHNEPLRLPPTQSSATNSSPSKQQAAQRKSKSPYFATAPDASQRSPRRSRPLRGTVSSLPFPHLDAASFGLVQEELASDPFQLLIAVTFLIRTTGIAAIPTFSTLMERYPTPRALADANTDDIVALIRHLGLGVVRAAAIQKYARMWLETPPRKGVRYGVRNYPDAGDGGDVRAGEVLDDEDARTGAWEIGHMTQGPYAIDSWRIFCRDVLRGVASDFKGGGREGEFQPEWMRVLPRDKELRACLRWMWMQEGWEWDPETGDRKVLSLDLRNAVQEGRVGYDDDTGDLRVLPEVVIKVEG